MTRDQALSVLAKLKPQLQSQFGVSELALFGSAARNELHVGRDIDVLVKFDAPATSLRYFGVQFAIEITEKFNLHCSTVCHAEISGCLFTLGSRGPEIAGE